MNEYTVGNLQLTLSDYEGNTSTIFIQGHLKVRLPADYEIEQISDISENWKDNCIGIFPERVLHVYSEDNFTIFDLI